MKGNPQRDAAKKFAEYWMFNRPGSERSGCQQFWNMLLRELLGQAELESLIRYEVPVSLKGSTKFLDAWIPSTRVLIEHKSRGVKLDAPQPGHDDMTPFEQAKFYDDHRPFDEKARWIVTCNFDEIWIYDQSKPLDPPEKITLGTLPNEVHRLAFLVHAEVKKIERRELEISVQAGKIVGTLYDALLKQYAEPENPETLKALNKLCVRLVFCLYAEDADVFGKNLFRKLVAATPADRLRRTLLTLFQVLDTPPEHRDRYLEPELAAFPYTNGGLYRDVSMDEIPPLTEEIKALLLGSSDFDWSEINTTIFGALFESTLNPVTRRAGGMVYTSGENIHKLIDPLFLNALYARFDEIMAVKDIRKRNRQLLEFQDRLASLTFLDPACGSGNFLTETYTSLRRLENRIIAAIQGDQPELDLGLRVKVSIGQFHGIEINDFAVTVAKTAMWISEAKMLRETAELLHRSLDFLPLRDYAGIVEGNALRMEWEGILVNSDESEGSANASPHFDYIIGNPPFVGARNKSAEQARDVEEVFRGWKNAGNLDYVTCWYKKAADYMSATGGASRAAFVSTNSICQGDGVAILWKPLFAQGVEIDYAWRTFRWDNESFEKAHVHVVIIGFHCGRAACPQAAATAIQRNAVSSELRGVRDNAPYRRVIFDETGTPHKAKHVNAYLTDAADVFVESRRKPIVTDAPELVFGSMPNDGGNLSDWNTERKNAVVEKYPAAAAMFRKLLGSHEAINGIPRWCLWLKGVSPSLIRTVPPVLEAVEKVRELRLASNRAATRKLAATPTLFGEIRQPDDGSYLLIPSVSSEHRDYVPMCFLDADVITNNLAFILPGTTLYHFGVLTSSVHMAWMRTVCGRLEMRYRYSAAIVYNNFPWPFFAKTTDGKPEVDSDESDGSANASQNDGGCGARSDGETVVKPDLPTVGVRSSVAATAQAILDARALYPDSSLADLYDPLTMPPELRKAHAANDAAVLKAYGWPTDLAEPEIVSRLFEMYGKLTAGEV